VDCPASLKPIAYTHSGRLIRGDHSNGHLYDYFAAAAKIVEASPDGELRTNNDSVTSMSLQRSLLPAFR